MILKHFISYKSNVCANEFIRFACTFYIWIFIFFFLQCSSIYIYLIFCILKKGNIFNSEVLFKIQI